MYVCTVTQYKYTYLLRTNTHIYYVHLRSNTIQIHISTMYVFLQTSSELTVNGLNNRIQRTFAETEDFCN